MNTGGTHIVGQALGQSATSGVFFWGFVLIVLVVAGLVVVLVVRRKMSEEEDSPGGGGGGFTLADLREMHASGKMTTDEFERAKHALVEGLKAASMRAASERAEQSGKPAGGGRVPPERKPER